MLQTGEAIPGAEFDYFALLNKYFVRALSAILPVADRVL
jgi:hypothetical protein